MLLRCLIACVVIFACGCRSYTHTTPRECLEGDNAANYQRVFREAAPARCDRGEFGGGELFDAAGRGDHR